MTGSDTNSKGLCDDDFKSLISALNNSIYLDKNLLTDDISKKDLNIKPLTFKEDELNIVVKPKSVKEVMYEEIDVIDYYITDGFKKVPVYKKKRFPIS